MRPEIENIAKRTIEYLSDLPNGTVTTMYEAVNAACPDLVEQLDLLNYFELDCIVSEAEKTGVVLDFSSHDGLAEGLPFNMDFIVWKKRLQKAQLISDLLCYGPCPEPNEPVEQRMIISSTGRIWFTEYLFAEHQIGRRVQMSIGKPKAMAILSLLADFAENEPIREYATDIGTWDLHLTYSDGKKLFSTGSMCGKVLSGEIDIADFIRERVPIEDLALFGLD